MSKHSVSVRLFDEPGRFTFGGVDITAVVRSFQITVRQVDDPPRHGTLTPTLPVLEADPGPDAMRWTPEAADAEVEAWQGILHPHG